MPDTHELLINIDLTIEKFFPKKWKEKNFSFFIGEPKFEIDSKTLNKNLNDPIRDFVLRGGKRIRPLIFLTCIDFFGLNYKNYLDFAAIIELLHNGTLVLDDIEDNAALRRGKPTCHKKFGLDTATNTGVSLHLLPLKILLSKRKTLPPAKELAIWQIIMEELINVSFGQALDIYWHKNKSADEVNLKRYLEMVRLKTGSLMRMSTRLACVIAGEGEKIQKIFKDFGESIGVAFQIIDDCLDLAPPDEKFGKSVGNDITEGKLSLPVIYALRILKNQNEFKKRERLIQILSKHTRDRKLIHEAIDLIKGSGAIRKSVKFANKLIDKTWLKLEEKLDRKNGKLDSLQELSYFLVKRNF
ncbi:polyprenyl synthetase family protein [Candidatus Woesebacteria bacterium]|nr:polyprenyl synthetase family protein [Candidatus Woesebacteria bacterium]QQG47003.1 MAG: polyprenyl synthetase family protein [Candidatus Woesebacteria bacterium]